MPSKQESMGRTYASPSIKADGGDASQLRMWLSRSVRVRLQSVQVACNAVRFAATRDSSSIGVIRVLLVSYSCPISVRFVALVVYWWSITGLFWRPRWLRMAPDDWLVP